MGCRPTDEAGSKDPPVEFALSAADEDGDGYEAVASGGDDCDDEIAAIHPGAIEIAYDGIDQDCSGADLTDVDGDGYSAALAGGEDCEDGNDFIHPDAPEICNYIDDDCNALVDDADPGVVGQDLWYLDADGDGFGGDSPQVLACYRREGTSATGGDCDDAHADAHPGGLEVPYDGIDQDCSGADLTDTDGDGYSSVLAGGDDCEDGDQLVFPGAPEICNYVDDDCNSLIDDADPAVVGQDVWYLDIDGDGFGDTAAQELACYGREGTSATGGDCDDAHADAHPGGVEVAYDGIDQDCSGADLTDADGDGFDADIVGGTDCDDGDERVHPDAPESCNEVDDDCDGSTDEPGGSGEPSWYPDADGDGYGAEAGAVVTCVQPTGYLADSTDCDDVRADIHPRAVEVPYDGLDQDCSGADLTDVDVDAHSAVVVGGDDCDDGDATVYPGAPETPYDGVDQDCSGSDLEDVDGDAHAAAIVGGDDCDDGDPSIHPDAAEVPNDGVDQDCSGFDFVDGDGDGYAASSAGGDDCDDRDATVSPAAPELAGNGVDDNCDGLTDETSVCADGTGDFATIQEAVDDGATLVALCAGTYVENVVVYGSLELEGSTDDPDAVVLQAADPLQFALYAYGGDLTVRGVSFDAGLAVQFDYASSVTLDTDQFCPASGVWSVANGYLALASDVFTLERSRICLWNASVEAPVEYAGWYAHYVSSRDGSHGGIADVEANVFDLGADPEPGSNWGGVFEFGSDEYFSNNLLIGGAFLSIVSPSERQEWVNNTFVGVQLDFELSHSGPTTGFGAATFRDNVWYATTSLTAYPDYPGFWNADYWDYSWDTLATCGTVQPGWDSGLIFTDQVIFSTLRERVCTQWFCEDAYTLEYDCTADSLMYLASIRSDPMFAPDARRGSYALGADSPALDAGVGDPDPDGSPNDMGAFGGPGGNWYLEVPWLIP